jgi:hypothetical protein
MDWKLELDALIESTMAFAKDVKPKPISAQSTGRWRQIPPLARRAAVHWRGSDRARVTARKPDPHYGPS